MGAKMRDELDELDIAIMTKLSRDARKSYLEIGRELKVSGATVHDRVRKLRERGIIEGFYVRFDQKKLGRSVTAYVGLITSQKKNLFQMVESLRKVKEVEEAHSVTGQYDFLIKLRAPDNEQLQKLLTDQIGSLPGVVRHETMIAMTTLLEKNEGFL
jgi:Lrp/AsnC family transcriptional regulator for asnA, asnC and gidA